jgi:uncharacterized membrane protein YhaH (DUF805 family)
MIAFIILMVRRLNDLDHSGWYSLLAVIPGLNGVLTVFLTFLPGKAGSNPYGAAPVGNSQAVVCAAIAIFPASCALGVVIGMLGIW